MKSPILLAAALALPTLSGCMALQPPGPAVADTRAVAAEAQAFMESYASDLRSGDRAAIAARYFRGGAWFVGNGEKRFLANAGIEAIYAGAEWSPPASFAWRDLSFEPLGADAVVVVGLFDWGAAEGQAPVTVSYTGLLLRQDGELRLRLEDESAQRSAAPSPARPTASASD